MHRTAAIPHLALSLLQGQMKQRTLAVPCVGCATSISKQAAPTQAGPEAFLRYPLETNLPVATIDSSSCRGVALSRALRLLRYWPVNLKLWVYVQTVSVVFEVEGVAASICSVELPISNV